MTIIENHELLSDATIQQIENDIADGSFDALHDMFESLILNDKSNKKILVEYMTDSVKEDLIEGRIKTKLNIVS